ncbi:MAG: plasmid mobilization protein [Oscillospiraceae bacterium]
MSEKEKKAIERNAEKCRLSVSEHLRQRALGYMPKAGVLLFQRQAGPSLYRLRG